jgi:hypothetical protein
MTEFVIFCFVSIVVFSLGLSVIGLFIFEIINPDEDRSVVIGTLSDIINTIIGALIGYLAGKGQGKAEAQDEIRESQERIEIAKQTTEEEPP